MTRVMFGALLACTASLACSEAELGEADLGAIEQDAGAVERDAEAEPDGGTLPDLAALDAGASDGGGSLPEGVFRIDGISPMLPREDLAPLGAMIGDASVVALGESVHTTRGYSEAKDRIFRYLVTELGFRVFAFESPRTAARSVGKYVSTCRGDARAALREGLFFVWGNQSVLDLVEWMCAWNRDHPDDPVRFTGFDTQQPWDDFPAIRSAISLAGSEAARRFEALSVCEGSDATSVVEYYRGPWGQITPSENNACIAAIDAFEAYVAQERAALVAASSVPAVEELERALIGIRAFQLQQYFGRNNALNPRGNVGLSYESRDRGMAQTLLRQIDRDYPNERVVVWAHNSHIARAHDRVTGFYGGAKSLGTFMTEALGEAYYAVMLTGYEVSTNWPGVGIGPQPPVSDPSSLEAQLKGLGEPFVLVDLVGADLELPFDPRARMSFAHYFGTAVPADQFQAVLYIEVVEMMRRL